ncbi:uncharacterized protein CBL_08928 [Carabus blaptoides fortunei]
MSIKVAVVTGANKGIGFGIVKGLCEKFTGTIYLTARDVQRGETAVKELEKLGHKPKFHQLDITDQSSVDRFKDYLKETHGGLDVLVNNVGIAYQMDSPVPFAEQADETMNVNFFGLVRICKALFPLLRPYARVVNVSSSLGHLARIPGKSLREKIGSPTLTEDELVNLMKDFVESSKNNTHETDGWSPSAYFVSKVGVSALSFVHQRQFDAEADKRPGICVNAVHPGFVATDMTKDMDLKPEWSVEQGADAPLYLALLPIENTAVKGCFVWKDRTIYDWKSEDCALY